MHSPMDCQGKEDFTSCTTVTLETPSSSCSATRGCWGDLELPGDCWPGQEVMTKTQSCISGARVSLRHFVPQENGTGVAQK